MKERIINENWKERLKMLYTTVAYPCNYEAVKDFIQELLETKKPDKRNPEIQALWEYGLELGFTETKQNLQRFALKRLK